MIRNPASPEYHYFIKDLPNPFGMGNTRATITDADHDGVLEFNSNEILQTADYYPFGMMHYSQGGTNKYLYNGKELQEEGIGGVGLDWYDYGARFYDPALGRFLSLGPKADEFPHVSPYNYAENRPIDGIDLWGLQWAPAPYKTSTTINVVKSIKVNPQSQALGRRMFSDATMIGGGLVLTFASAGITSPLLASGGLLGGTYGMAGGTAKLTLDMAGRESDADKFPNTITGGVVGKSIDFQSKWEKAVCSVSNRRLEKRKIIEIVQSS